MKVILLFDQIQAGYGGKERPNTPLGLEKGGIGSYLMFKDVFADHDLKVLATVYCGPDYFQANKEEVLHKIANLMKKAQPDVLLCGPCFNYDTYAQMAAEVAAYIQDQTPVRAYVACSAENEAVVDHYKDQVKMIQMPKKGGVGLTDALRHIAEILSGPAEADWPHFFH